jgi:hypothetical protein
MANLVFVFVNVQAMGATGWCAAPDEWVATPSAANIIKCTASSTEKYVVYDAQRVKLHGPR